MHYTLYTLDSSIIDLCLSVFDWAKFRRSKGGIKLHSLFDLKTQIPAFNVITSAKESDVMVAKQESLPLIPDSIITFDRAYVDFKLFQAYEDANVFFVTRSKENLRFEFLGQQDIPKKKGLQFDQMGLLQNTWVQKSEKSIKKNSPLKRPPMNELPSLNHLKTTQKMSVFKKKPFRNSPIFNPN